MLLYVRPLFFFPFFFFFNDTATTEIYTLSLHDALPIFASCRRGAPRSSSIRRTAACRSVRRIDEDRKSTRLNSSHVSISYAVFCLKKKKSTMNSLSSLTSTVSQIRVIHLNISDLIG